MEYSVDQTNKVIVFTDCPDLTVGAFSDYIITLSKAIPNISEYSLRFKEAPAEFDMFNFKMPELNILGIIGRGENKEKS